MPSKHEEFWQHGTYAVIGNSAVKPFPTLTYNALKEQPDKVVFAVDASCDQIEGDAAYSDLNELPKPVDAAVLEVPREETAAWIERLAAVGVNNVWIHMGRETPQALALAEEKGLQVCSGTCAVQYLTSGFPHNIHRLLRKLSGRW